MLIGTIAGGIGNFVAHPFDTLKVRQQMAHRPVSLAQVFKNSAKSEGLSSLMKGVSPPTYAHAALFAILYSVNDYSNKNITYGI